MSGRPAGAILLIAGKRSDQISSELAVNDYHADQQTLEQLAELRRCLDDLQATLSQPGPTDRP